MDAGYIGKVVKFTYKNGDGQVKNRRVYVQEATNYDFSGHDFSATIDHKNGDFRHFRCERLVGSLTIDKTLESIDITRFSKDTIDNILQDLEKKGLLVVRAGRNVIAVLPEPKADKYELVGLGGGFSINKNGVEQVKVVYSANKYCSTNNTGSRSEYESTKVGLVAALRKAADLVERS